MQLTKAIVMAVVALAFALQCQSAYSEEKKTRLEQQNYDLMTLVAIKEKSGEWLACFKLIDESYEVARIGSQVGLYRASIIKFTSEYIVVSQPLLVNGYEWVDSEFSWPISESSDRRKWPCQK